MGMRHESLANPFEDDFSRWSSGFVGDDGFAADNGFGFGSQVHHVVQMYLLPNDTAGSPWKAAGLAILLVTLLMCSLIFIYYCVLHCCIRKKPVTDEENADEEPSSVCGEHPGNPSQLPPVGFPEKPASRLVASFRDSPSLNVSQPYQPEPEDLARMQERMLAQLETTNQDWELGHGDLDTKPLH